MEEHMVRAPSSPHLPTWLYAGGAPKQFFFHNCEWGEGWHETSESIKWYGGNWKVENISWMKSGKRENPWKIPKNSDIVQSSCYRRSSLSSSVFCPRAGLSLQTQAPRLQFCPKAGLPSQTQEPRLQFCQGLNRCGSFPLLSAPTLSLASEQILKDLKGSQGHQRGGEENGFCWLGPPKFTTGVKYQFRQGLWPDQRSGNPNHPSPPIRGLNIKIKKYIRQFWENICNVLHGSWKYWKYTSRVELLWLEQQFFL